MKILNKNYKNLNYKYCFNPNMQVLILTMLAKKGKGSEFLPQIQMF